MSYRRPIQLTPARAPQLRALERRARRRRTACLAIGVVIAAAPLSYAISTILVRMNL